MWRAISATGCARRLSLPKLCPHMDAYAETVVAIQVMPRAGRDRHELAEGDLLRIWLAAPPVDGAANKALLRYLGKSLGIPPTSMTIISGETSRSKRVRVPLSLESILQKLTSTSEGRKR